MDAQGQDHASVRSFVNQLTRAERQVLMLHYAEELTPREIGAVLDLTVPRVELILQRLRLEARAAIKAPIGAA